MSSQTDLYLTSAKQMLPLCIKVPNRHSSGIEMPKKHVVSIKVLDRRGSIIELPKMHHVNTRLAVPGSEGVKVWEWHARGGGRVAHCTLHFVHYTLHIAHCILHMTHYTLHIARCTGRRLTRFVGRPDKLHSEQWGKARQAPHCTGCQSKYWSVLLVRATFILSGQLLRLR